MFDTHIHTRNSRDSEQTPDEICLSAISKGMRAITFTDHNDTYAYTMDINREILLGSMRDAEYARNTYGDKLEILAGIELGEPAYDRETAAELISMIDADVILGSIHALPLDGKKIGFSSAILDEETITMKELHRQMDAYFHRLLAAAQHGDIDVLCHITYPLRYINKKYNRGLDISIYSDIITLILQTLIERQIALELNSAKVYGDISDLSPTLDIVMQYYDMGGRLITLASDAHVPDMVGNAFDTMKEELRKIGFKHYYYYKKRKPIAVDL